METKNILNDFDNILLSNVEYDRIIPLTEKFQDILKNVLGFTVVIRSEEDYPENLRPDSTTSKPAGEISSRYIYVFDSSYLQSEAEAIVDTTQEVARKYSRDYSDLKAKLIEKGEIEGNINDILKSYNETYPINDIIEHRGLKILIERFENTNSRVFILESFTKHRERQFISLLRFSGHPDSMQSKKQTEHEGKYSKYKKVFKVEDQERHNKKSLEEIKAQIICFFNDIIDTEINSNKFKKIVDDWSDLLVDRTSVEYKKLQHRKA